MSLEVSDDLPDQRLYRPEEGKPKCPETQKKTMVLIDLCVTDAKSKNGSTVWVESVCSNSSLTFFSGAGALPGIGPPALPVWSPE